MGKAINTCADNLGYFNPPNVYRPAIIDIRIVGEYSAEDGATNTYRITQNDGKIFEFDVKNGSGGSAGRSVTSVEQIQISTESLGKNIARITLSDGTYTDVEIRNGAQGGPGPQGLRGPAGIDSVEASIGTNDPTQAPSVDKDLNEGVLSLTFNNIKGAKGDQGEPAVAVENYVTVEATSSTTSATDVLPATGSADTVYRVSNWDGTQYNTNAYTEYGWYNGAYKPLASRTPGIDDEPTAGSQKLVKSGGVASQISQLGQDVDDLDSISSLYKKNIELEFDSSHNGYYINTSGQIREASGAKYSEPYFLKKGTILKFKVAGQEGVFSIITRVLSSGTFVAVKISDTSTYKWYEYEVEESGYYIFCGYDRYEWKLYASDTEYRLSVAEKDIAELQGDVYAMSNSAELDIVDTSSLEFGNLNGATHSTRLRSLIIPDGSSGNGSYVKFTNSVLLPDSKVSMIIMVTSDSLDDITDISHICRKDNSSVNIATNITKTRRGNTLLIEFDADLSNALSYNVSFTLSNNNTSGEKVFKYAFLMRLANTSVNTINSLIDVFDNYEHRIYDNAVTYSVVHVYTQQLKCMYINVAKISNARVYAKSYSGGVVKDVTFVNATTGLLSTDIFTNGVYFISLDAVDYLEFYNISSENNVPLSVYWSRKIDFVEENVKTIDTRNSTSISSSLHVGLIPLAIDSRNNKLYCLHQSNKAILKVTADNFITINNVYTFDTNIIRANVCANGNIVVLLDNGSLQVSSNNGESFIQTHNFGTYKPHELFGINQYKNILLFTTYQNNYQTPDGRTVWLSTDGGNTLQKIFDLTDWTESYNAHLHSAVYDPYDNIIWICSGDGRSQQMLFVSFDLGTTFKRVTEYDKMPFQATEIIPLRNCVLFASDQRLVGVARWMRYYKFSTNNPLFVFDFPFLIKEEWGKSTSTEVPIASSAYVDYDKSIAFFGFALVGTAINGNSGDELKYGQIYATDGNKFKIIYRDTELVRNGIQQVIGNNGDIYVKYVNDRYNVLHLVEDII